MIGWGKGLTLVMLVLGSMGRAVRADDFTAARQYGAGVHDFFQGRYFEAIEHFDRALAENGRDPRVYYFRGLAKRRLGWIDDARTDFLMGSQLEVALKRRDVGMALQRVQGADRLTVERFRREARALPEAMVQSVVPQPMRSIVQKPVARPPARAAVRHYAAAELPVDDSDPFREGAPGLLGRGEIEAVADQATSGVAQQATQTDASTKTADEFGDEEPFGSGVVAEAQSDADVQDPFAADDTAGTDSRPSASGAAATPARGGGANGGVLGAALRAFSRTMVPAETLSRQGEKIMEGMRGGAGGPRQPAEANRDPFAEPAAANGESAGGTSAEAEPDPFAEPVVSDTPANRSDQSTGQPQAPADDSGDPFVDDDPFKF
jgi:hypothetical protein